MPFGFSPLAVKAIGIGLLVLALIAGFALFTAHEQALGEEKNKAEVAQASLKLAQDNVAKSAQIVATQKGAIHDAQLQAGAANAAAARAASERDAFRVRLNAFLSASRGPKPATAASGSAPAPDSLDVLADVLGRADDRAQALAAYADQARIAGLACERSYDALSAVK